MSALVRVRMTRTCQEHGLFLPDVPIALPLHLTTACMMSIQDVDLRTLPDGNMVDLVMSMHALAMHPPPQLAHRLQDECIRRLTQRSGSSALPPVGSGASAAASETVVDTIRRPGP